MNLTLNGLELHVSLDFNVNMIFLIVMALIWGIIKLYAKVKLRDMRLKAQTLEEVLSMLDSQKKAGNSTNNGWLR